MLSRIWLLFVAHVLRRPIDDLSGVWDVLLGTAVVASDCFESAIRQGDIFGIQHLLWWWPIMVPSPDFGRSG